MKLKAEIALSETGFLFHPSTGNSYSVNPIGRQLLEMMKQGQSEEEIKTEILTRYEVEETQWEEDYYDFVQYLKQLKLLDNV